jgi:DNA invertase Pin-like site-specific DNA recombinase
VYDVSRWGRFQDPDEAAAYELQCKRAGVAVRYCAEEFENDGSVNSSLLKALKRVMAGEYSRELSVKTRRGQLNLLRKGFHVGGPAPFGMRRVVVDDAGNETPLTRGQWKAVISDRDSNAGA